MSQKTLILILVSCLVASFMSAAVWAETAQTSLSVEAGSAMAAFENLKKLEGTWTGKDARGGEVEVDYAVTGGGTALTERYRMDGHGEMLTVYHLDGESILLTHYCSTGNQPRMRATEFSAVEDLRFDFVDVSGLASSDDGYMHHALVRYRGGDTMTSDWTFREKGQDQFTESVTIERAD